MKLTILSGSPKGEPSITLQYLDYIKKRHSEHSYHVVHVGKEINKIQNDVAYFNSIMEEIKSSDAVIWVFPVYFLAAPSPVHRFAELIWENQKEDIFKGKYATAITTSVHFYDHTAHNYIHGVSEDLGMHYFEGFSAEMEDLLRTKERENLLKFAKNFFYIVSEKIPLEKRFKPLSYDMPEYKPAHVENIGKTRNKKILIITDGKEEDINLKRMIDVFKKVIPNETDIINLNDVNIKGGCLSCYLCMDNNICPYKDEHNAIISERLMTADAIIFAGRMRNRFFSYLYKMFWDRSFFKGHCPIFEGKQMAYIISGPLRENSNLREFMEGFSQVGRTNLAGVVTDEYEDSSYITTLLENLARQILWGIDESFQKPTTFLEVGGHMIFRDLVYRNYWLFRADYNFYRKHKLFDYPHNDLKSRLTGLIFSILLMLPGFKKEFYRKSKEEMIKPYKKVIDDI